MPADDSEDDRGNASDLDEDCELDDEVATSLLRQSLLRASRVDLPWRHLGLTTWQTIARLAMPATSVRDQQRDVLELFLACLPLKYIVEVIIPATNAQLVADGMEGTTLGEFLRSLAGPGPDSQPQRCYSTRRTVAGLDRPAPPSSQPAGIHAPGSTPHPRYRA
eukprot:m.256953 g.256953  ORF g.256953 m.256953 type:complete len:164 (+) comp20522_c0_seq1:121-612(+)